MQGYDEAATKLRAVLVAQKCVTDFGTAVNLKIQPKMLKFMQIPVLLYMIIAIQLLLLI